jgi:hypothetical protein
MSQPGQPMALGVVEPKTPSLQLLPQDAIFFSYVCGQPPAAAEIYGDTLMQIVVA